MWQVPSRSFWLSLGGGRSAPRALDGHTFHGRWHEMITPPRLGEVSSGGSIYETLNRTMARSHDAASHRLAGARPRSFGHGGAPSVSGVGNYGDHASFGSHGGHRALAIHFDRRKHALADRLDGVLRRTSARMRCYAAQSARCRADAEVLEGSGADQQMGQRDHQ